MQKSEKKEATVEEFTLEDALDEPIAYRRVFALWVGACGAIFLSQAHYWSQRTSDPEGWFYKTRKEWEYETGLTRYEQETARKKSIKAGFLEERLGGNPARMYYRFSLEPLLKQLSLWNSTPLDSGNTANKKEENQQTFYTKNKQRLLKKKGKSYSNLNEDFEKKVGVTTDYRNKGQYFP